MSRLTQLKKIMPTSEAEKRNLQLAIREERRSSVFSSLKRNKPTTKSNGKAGTKRRSTIKLNKKISYSTIKKQVSGIKKNKSKRATPKYYNKQNVL